MSDETGKPDVNWDGSEVEVVHSEVKTRSGAVNGLFLKKNPKPIPATPESWEFFKQRWDAAFVPAEENVLNRISELEEKARRWAREHGFESWLEPVYEFKEEIHQYPLPERGTPQWEEITENQRPELQALLRDGTCELWEVVGSGIAGSFWPWDSIEHFAYKLEMACHLLRLRLKERDFWECMNRLWQAEAQYTDLRVKYMEAHYIRGKRQSLAAGGLNWERIMREWTRERPNHPSNRQCDKAIGEKYSRSPGTVKDQRRKHGVIYDK